jgi:DNA-binding transcriptional ArsR family regulator
MEAVFKALDDPSRRLLLDRLFERDGQSLAELCEHLPAMTRFGVMNHLGVLEAAGLVVTRKEGRRKLHYLNPVPIRLVHDRWISKYTEPIAGTLAAMTAHLEGGATVQSPSHVYQTYIRCTPEAAWQAITDGAATVRYYYGTRVESTWRPGDPIRYLAPDGSVVADGQVVACDPPRRLDLTFLPHWDPELEAEGPARMAWIVEESEGLTRVTVEYYDLGGKQAHEFMGGIPYIVSGLKTLLETGAPIAAGATMA